MPPPERLLRLWHAVVSRLHRRLAISFLATATAVLALVAVAAFLRARATLRAQLLDRLMAVALVKEAELNLWIDDQRADLAYLASLAQFAAPAARLAALPPGAPAHEATARDLTRQLAAARAGALDASALLLLAADGGRVIAATDSALLGSYHVADLFFVHGRSSVYVQNVYASPATGRPTLTIAAPIRATDGTTVAVLAAHLDLSRIDQILAARTGVGATGEAYLVTTTSDFVSGRRFGRADARRGVHTRGVDEALAGRNGTGVYANYRGVPVLGAWRWIAARQLALMVEVEAREVFAPARELVVTILAFGLGAVILLAMGIAVLARRLAQPITAVADAAARVARGDFDAVAPVLTRDEVGTLARTFNDMTARLRDLYDDLSEQIAATGRAYRALEENQRLLHAFVDNSSNLVLALDQKGRLLLVNRRVEALLGLPREELYGRLPAQVLPPDLAAAAGTLVERALEQRGPAEGDVAVASGAVRTHFHLVAFPLAHAGRAPFGAGLIGLDLTERLRQEDEHRRLEAGVQQAQKLESLGLLAGGIAHDFNNILTAIVGGTSIALDDLPPDARARGDLEQVIAAAERASKLTRQMLAYAGRASFAIEVFDLNMVIGEMAELIGVSVSRSVRLEQALGTGLPAIRADRTQISQVVLNLVTNAAEAAALTGGHVRIATRRCGPEDLAIGAFRLEPADAAAYVELAVADDGGGITPETMEKMFDPFYSTKGTGRGLGLAAVLGIVKQSGGGLRVQSRPGEGTTFTVVFPAAAEPAVTTAERAVRGTAPPAAGVVLLVDDEDAVRRMARRALERGGFEVVEAVNGREGVDAFLRERERLTAIVLDVTMPVMGGAEAFQLMREAGPRIPVLVSSGFDHQDTAHLFTGEAVDFLQKPYRPEALLDRLRALARARPAWSARVADTQKP